MKKNNQFITRTALIAAAYAALTYAFAWMSYKELQFRISEVLVLFAFIIIINLVLNKVMKGGSNNADS